jgi:hypothetical protein
MERPPEQSGATDPPPPFFIVGAPRTGSTLLRRLLCAHSRVAIPPETGFMAEYLAADHIPLDRRKRLLTRDPELGYWGLAPEDTDLARCGSIGACFALLHERYASAQGKDVWGNKTPRLVWHGELLLRHFPDARFVHLVRDGRAVARSLRASKAHRLHVQQGARRYARDTARGLALERDHPNRCLRVYYENLIQAPEATLREVCAFIDITFERRMLRDTPDDDLPLTPMEERSGHHAHVHDALQPGFARRWQAELNETELRLIEAEAAEVLTALGYPLSTTGHAGRGARAVAQLAHLRWVVTRAWQELTERPDVWRIAWRRAVLGSLGPALRTHTRGV